VSVSVCVLVTLASRAKLSVPITNRDGVWDVYLWEPDCPRDHVGYLDFPTGRALWGTYVGMHRLVLVDRLNVIRKAVTAIRTLATFKLATEVN